MKRSQWKNNHKLLDENFHNVDIVVACACNRQIGHARESAFCIKEILKAMEKNKIENIIALSSCGIGSDWPPMRYS